MFCDIIWLSCKKLKLTFQVLIPFLEFVGIFLVSAVSVNDALTQDVGVSGVFILDLSASDYVELYARHTDANNQDMDAVYTRFWAFKLTGV